MTRAGLEAESAARPSRAPWRAVVLTLVLTLTVLAAAIAMLSPAATVRAETAAAPKATTIDARTAHTKAMAGELVLVDIRSPEEWRQTGVPASAWAIPFEQKPPALIAALTTVVGGDKTKPLALICATGGRSSYLAGQLRGIGFSHVMDVGEGVMGSRSGRGWLKAGLPVRPGAEAANPPRLDAAAQPATPAVPTPQTTGGRP